MGDEDPIYESVEVTLQIPKKVDELWRSLGYDAEIYQYEFYDTTRSVLELLGSDLMTPAIRGALAILKDEIKRVNK